jgi:hypothetical protein
MRNGTPVSIGEFGMCNEKKVYTSKNLCFATKEASRQPTLYFRSPDGCGRIRQEHARGPKIQDVRTNMLDVFFKSSDQLDAFYIAFGAIPDSQRTVSRIHDLMAQKQGVGIAFNDAYHFECTVSKEGLCSKRHKSGGTVVLGAELEKIRPQVPNIYASIPRLDG